MTTDDLLFVSFRGRVFAIERGSGAIVWRWQASKGNAGAVMLLPDGNTLFVSADGYTWALDPRDGRELWFQPFEGEGVGIPMLATMRSASHTQQTPVMNAAQVAAAAAAIAATTAAATAAT
jgi:hypothetical protein